MSDSINQSEKRAKLQELKLNSLLNLTRASSTTDSQDEFIAVFSSILKKDLLINKFILFIDQDGWTCLIKAGHKAKINPNEHLTDLLYLTEITTTKSKSPLIQEFNLILPIIHGDKPLAYLLLPEKQDDNLTKEELQSHLEFVQTLSNIFAVSLENKRLLNEKTAFKEAINRELEVASALQKLLFPSNLPKNLKMDISAKHFAKYTIGGDYYDFIDLGDGEFIICIADVSGKGIAAAMLMANFQATLRTLFRYQRFDLSFLIEELNKKILANARGEKFISFFIGHYNTYTRKLKYINAGHNHPVLLMKKEVKLLNEGCIGLGIFEELPSLKVGKIILPQNSTLVLYTDGVIELENKQGKQFSLERLIKAIQSFSSLSMQDMNGLLFSKLNEWADIAEHIDGDGITGAKTYSDDTAILSCKFF